MQLDMLVDYACVVGEGPLYHPLENAVYWTDIETGRFFRIDATSGESHLVYQGDKIGGFTLQADGSLLLFMDRGAIKVFRDGAFVKTLYEELPDESDTRFNDVIADPQGRVFCGTMPKKDRLGRLYRLDTDGTVALVLENIGCSNGMAFTQDRKTLYYTDTGKREIYRFAYDEATGEITDQFTLITTPEGRGWPDGMTIDTEGNLWTAKWGGGGVECYSPKGVLLYTLEMPTRIVSCVTFGGPDYTDMYLTTAGGNRKDENGDLAGALFRIRGLELNGKPVAGLPEYFSRVGL